MTRRLLPLALLLPAATPLAAQPADDDHHPRHHRHHRHYGHWRSSAVGGGGFQLGTAVAPTDPDVVYAWNDVGGLHRSEDAGRTWHALHGNLPTADANYRVG